MTSERRRELSLPERRQKLPRPRRTRRAQPYRAEVWLHGQLETQKSATAPLSIDNRGGPLGTTRNITVYIVQAFRDFSTSLGPGYGSAVAMLLFAIILALTLLQFRVLGRRVHYS